MQLDGNHFLSSQVALAQGRVLSSIVSNSKASCGRSKRDEASSRSKR